RDTLHELDQPLKELAYVSNHWGPLLAIAGGHGSKGAKVGAGVGLVGGLLHHRAEAQYSEAKYQHDVDSVMKQCMVGRGYNVLN
ncbi:hypothetical protein ACPV45_23215, partial [Vibrio mediterranei]